ncbi:MAG: helix-turn-helix domain-containing protein [Deltaproteobacteria bacterium]|nr:helix-turn-helix domain-containing protein [Deltaproteobacteria bacterium]
MFAHLYDPITGEKLLTAEEAAVYLDYHRVSIRRLVSQGVLRPYKRAGNTLLFLKADLDRFKLTNAWAARKASVEIPPVAPQKPPSNLEAAVKLDLGLGPIFGKALEPIKNFTWDQIPLIRAEVDSKHGNIPFEVEIKSPDGGLWIVSYEPPTWFERLAKNFKKKRSRE